jgi:2-hydroxy-3-oxopropionate reductase
MSKPIIGFIGLGNIGKPSAKHLLDSGYDLIVHDVREPPAEELRERGAGVGETPTEVAQASDVIITSLPEGEHVKEVVLGETGLIEGVSEGQVFIDMSTIGAIAFREVAEVLEEQGVDSIDAPVSGGVEGAQNASLSIMVGGDADIIETHRPILEVMSDQITHIGDRGAGQVAKIANNMIAGANLVAVAEALVFVEMAGVDSERVYEAIKDGAARSWALQHRGPWMLEETFEPGFKGSYHYKDLRIAMNDAQELGTPMPLSAVTHEMFKVQEQTGWGDLDESAVIKVFEWMSGSWDER